MIFLKYQHGREEKDETAGRLEAFAGEPDKPAPQQGNTREQGCQKRQKDTFDNVVHREKVFMTSARHRQAWSVCICKLANMFGRCALQDSPYGKAGPLATMIGHMNG